jgi:shikimate dehydrogenase
VGSADDIPAADLVVNATSIGMAGANAGADAPPLPFDPELLHAGQVVVDVVYHPPVTPLLDAATQRGARAVPGLGMLVHQAAHAFRRWTGDDPPVAAMAAAASAELDRRTTGSEFDATHRRDAT